ncbi:MAG: hypothetical protein K2X46_02910, partial [Roseomonas sp.]|nr:hypothetical protein [Roseomonas sp.]
VSQILTPSEVTAREAAAWIAGRDAAKRAIVGKLPSNTHAFCLFTVAEAAKKIAALTPPASLAAALDAVVAAAVAQEREAILALVDAEPELPGDPPQSIIDAVVMRPAEYMRVAVHVTKEKIAASIRARGEAGR